MKKFSLLFAKLYNITMQRSVIPCKIIFVKNNEIRGEKIPYGFVKTRDNNRPNMSL